MSKKNLLWAVAPVLLVSCGGGGGSGGGIALPIAAVNAPATTNENAPAPAPAPAGTPVAAPPAAPAAGPAAAPAGPPVAAPPPAAATPAPPSGPLKVTEVATGLPYPWSLAFLPDGRMLITERTGRLHIRNANGSAINGGNDIVCCVPAVDSDGQGGLLDVALDPAFATNKRIYMTIAERDTADATLNGTAVIRAVLDADNRTLSGVTVIYRQAPKVQSEGHFGSRLAFDNQGYLFVTMGERQLDSQRGFAQDLTRGNGKVARITTDGAPAPGNPNFGVAGAQPAIWSYGHRNPQGAAMRPGTNQLWTSEHGPQGGDEVNLTQAGRNYGWPTISFGQEYGTLTQVGVGTAMAGMEQPAWHWDKIDGSGWTPGTPKSSTAPSGLAFYSAPNIPEWQGSMFVGALAGMSLWRLTMSGDTVVSQERLLAERVERIRDVRQGPDGWLYVLTDGASGKLLRLTR
ncbi:PQQ-dependent sugar dehydrogenase [Variovorax robiniae]|uniref:PQQ-dependent sugar dehydrogenase n=1 Tax=Variovorax robiniae TaxID=1836199 RepID=A0ABU8X5W2_9BURK